MNTERPDPDALLAKVQREEAKSRRGRLKIFFGAAAGVGKTYAMLSEAREKRAEGVDVAAGVVETHGRAETVALLQGLEVLPARIIEYRGTQIREFDLDGALKRRPTLILVDELAHTNAEGSRHPKRWNDVEELLDSGIDVYTTLNVQHLESLNDIISGITQIRVWETIPDTVFERADEVEIVDLPPDDLLERLREGKVYLPQQAERAIRNFFRKGNLIALRELALRRTAERVDAQMRDYRADQAIRDVWRAGERVLVCIALNPLASRLIRAGKRLATSLHADWIVAYVETPQLQRLPPTMRDRVLDYLRLAEELGAETITLSGQTMSSAILEYTRGKNVTKIVLGKPTRSGWQRWLLGSVVDEVVREAHDFDVYLLACDRDTDALNLPDVSLLNRSRAYLGLKEHDGKKRYPGYLWSIGTTALITSLSAFALERLELVNLVMLYLLGVMFIAMRFGRGPSVLSAVLSVAAFDFFFVSPRFSFAVSDIQYVVTFAVMLAVGLIVSTLTVNLRSQAKISHHRERRAGVLYTFTRELGSTQTEDEIARVAVKHIGEEFEGQSVVLLPDFQGRMGYPRSQSIQHSFHGSDLGVAQWVFDHGKIAGKGTDTLPGTEGVYFPMQGAGGALGVLALLPINLRRVFLPEQQRLIDTFIFQIVQAIERVQHARDAQVAKVRAETESLRNSLLSAISHDFRTPLASIVGASSSLIDSGTHLSEEAKLDLGKTIYEEARRMTKLANNLLDMARLEAGSVTLNRQWCPIEEIVGGVLTRLQARLTTHPVTVKLPPGLPLVHVDAVMIEQVLENLLENALKYTPPGTPIEIGADASPTEVSFWVADSGPGLPAGKEDRLFEKFYRGTTEGAQSGVGLGLTICRAIVEAHGGTIHAENRPQGGAIFRFAIPVTEEPPQIVPEEDRFGQRPMTQPNPVIVVIEDDPQIRRFLRTGLQAHGFEIHEADTGKQGLIVAATRKPDLIILDLGLPDMDGVEVIGKLREWTSRPVIILSARNMETDKVAALDAGADDYLTKPFGLDELLARIRVALRHASQPGQVDANNVFRSGNLKVDLTNRRVYREGEEVHLTPIEYRLLTTLVKHAGKVLTHRQLLTEVWGPGHVESSHYLRVYMGGLRHKLEADPARPKLFLTEAGTGYRLAMDVSAENPESSSATR